MAEQGRGVRRPSLADVAAHAGVSLTTASHALSGNRPVGRKTRRAIEQAIRELGYAPNHAARTLASGATLTLGLVVPDIGNEFFAQLAKGVEDRAYELGYHVLFTSTDFDPMREERALRLVSARAIDGLIYAAGAPPATGQLLELSGELPVAILDEELDLPGAITISSDNVEGGRLVADHLEALGHDSVLILAGPENLPTSEQRSREFRKRCAAGKLRCQERRGDYRGRAGYELVKRELVDHGLWFTAVFAHNDLMAISAMKALREAGLVVPHQVSVAGFDDISLAGVINPSLTTVRQPVRELGGLAAQRVIEATAAKEGRSDRILLPVSLISRDSTGPLVAAATSREEARS